jgi:hypothetical protein
MSGKEGLSISIKKSLLTIRVKHACLSNAWDARMRQNARADARQEESLTSKKVTTCANLQCLEYVMLRIFPSTDELETSTLVNGPKISEYHAFYEIPVIFLSLETVMADSLS